MKMTLSIAPSGSWSFRRSLGRPRNPRQCAGAGGRCGRGPSETARVAAAVADDAAAPQHVRALAMLGAGQTAATSAEALAIWQRLAEDAAAPAGTATRPAGALRKPSACRKDCLPEAALGIAGTSRAPRLAVVLHVAPSGDAGRGDRAAPLATLAGAHMPSDTSARTTAAAAGGRSAGCHRRRDVSRLRDVQSGGGGLGHR